MDHSSDLSPFPERRTVAKWTIAPLLQGARLTRDEFERRYRATPQLARAELIDGTVHIPAPIPFGPHGSPSFDLIGWLGFYTATTPGVDGSCNPSLRMDSINEPQPNACLIVLPQCGGQTGLDDEGFLVGGPELVAEVTSGDDFSLKAKLTVYHRNGVREYVVWHDAECVIDWFIFRSNGYERLSLFPGNQYHSQVFPGLWLDPAALINGDMLKVSQVVQQGLATPEHANFVAQLQQKATQQRP